MKLRPAKVLHSKIICQKKKNDMDDQVTARQLRGSVKGPFYDGSQLTH